MRIRSIDVEGVPTEAVVFGYRRGRAIFLAVLSLVGLVGIGVYWLRPLHMFRREFTFDLTRATFHMQLTVIFAVLFGMVAVMLIVQACRPHYVALTAEALIVHDLKRTVVRWDMLGSYGTVRTGRQSLLMIWLRANPAAPDVNERGRAAGQEPGSADADVQIIADQIRALPLLLAAMSWHQDAPRTEEALIAGYTSGWRGPWPGDG